MEKITSRRNPRCVHIKKLGTSRTYREACSEFLCDGLKLLEEAVNAGVEIRTVLTASRVPFPLPIDTYLYYADRSLIDSLSPLTNAQDTLFTCTIPKACGFEHTSGAHILLDGVQDPGNVGTIIRTAFAFGINCVILTGSCADPYNPKTVRASMGAIFRQRICHMDISELEELKDNGVRFVGAAPGEGSKDISQVRINDALIAIGSEGRGLSREVLSLCDERIVIPITPACESLNAAVASAIIIWNARS